MYEIETKDDTGGQVPSQCAKKKREYEGGELLSLSLSLSLSPPLPALSLSLSLSPPSLSLCVRVLKVRI